MTTTQQVCKHTKYTNLYKLYSFGFFDDKCTVIKEYDVRLLNVDQVINDILDQFNLDDGQVKKLVQNDIVISTLTQLEQDRFWNDEAYFEFQKLKSFIIASFEIADYDESDLFFVTRERVSVDHSASDLLYIN